MNLKDYPHGIITKQFQADIAQQLNARDIEWLIIHRYLSSGRFILLLDGFDEMGLQIDDRLRRVHFASILKLFEISKNKVIVTGRPGYFPSIYEYEEVLSLLNIAPKSIEKGDLIETVILAPFDEEQIQRYIKSYSELLPKTKLNQIKEIIKHVYNLDDLAERPFLLDLILKTVPDCNSALTGITPATLYELYTTQWIDREMAKGEMRWLISKQEKKDFMVEIAWRMLRKGALLIHFSELAEWVREYFNLSSPETVDYFAHDIRTCTFLKRDDGGNYSFIHRSFLEYFVAIRIVEHARAGSLYKMY